MPDKKNIIAIILIFGAIASLAYGIISDPIMSIKPGGKASIMLIKCILTF